MILTAHCDIDPTDQTMREWDREMQSGETNRRRENKEGDMSTHSLRLHCN